MSDLSGNLAGQAWAEPVDLPALIERLRAGGIDVNVFRVESDAPQGDAPDAQVVDCAACEGPSTVTGVELVAGHMHYRLDCHHLVKA